VFVVSFNARVLFAKKKNSLAATRINFFVLPLQSSGRYVDVSKKKVVDTRLRRHRTAS
jgi:hypothetical protein